MSAGPAIDTTRRPPDMLSVYSELRMAIDKAVDVVEFGIDDQRSIEHAIGLFQRHKYEFVYMARRLDPTGSGHIPNVCAKKPLPADRQGLQYFVDASTKMSDVLGLNERVCQDLIVTADSDLRDDIHMGPMSPLFKGIYSYYKAMTELFKALCFVFQFCNGRGYATYENQQLGDFATSFIVELQYLTHDLGLLVCDPKWTGSIATGRRSGIASVELKHLEAVGVFDSGETEKIRGKRIMEAVLLEQQDALASCIYQIADVSKLEENPSAVLQTPTLTPNEVLSQWLTVLIYHLKDKPAMDSISSALFVGLIRILNLEDNETGPDIEHPFRVPRSSGEISGEIDVKNDSPGVKFVKLVKKNWPKECPERRTLLFILGLLTSNTEEDSDEQGRELVQSTLKRRAAQVPLLSPAETYPEFVRRTLEGYTSFTTPGTFEYLLRTVLATPQFQAGHDYELNFSDVLHSFIAKFVDDPKHFWFSELETIRRSGVEHAEMKEKATRQIGAVVDFGRSDFQDIFDFAGGFNGAHNMSDAWQRWKNFVENSTAQLDSSYVTNPDSSVELICPSLVVPYFTMLRGIAGPDEASARQIPEDSDYTNAESVHLFLNRAHPSNFKWENLFNSLDLYSKDCHEAAKRRDRAIEQNQGFVDPRIMDEFTSVLGIPDHPVLLQLTSFVKLLRRVMDNDPKIADLLDMSGERTMIAIFYLIRSPVQPSLKAALLGVCESYCRASSLKSSAPQSQAAATWARIDKLFKGHLKNPEATEADRAKYQNLRAEIEDIEVKSQTYSFTTELLSLLNALVPHMPRLDPRTGYISYLDFVRDVVFTKYSRRGYEDSNEKWKVARAVLRLYSTLLDSYTPSERDFLIDTVQVDGPDGQPGDMQQAGYLGLSGPERAGFDFIVSILGEGAGSTSGLTTMQALFDVIEIGSIDDPAQRHPDTSAYNESIALALELILKLFKKQDLFLKYHGMTGAKGVEEYMLERSRGKELCTRVLNVAQYLWAPSRVNAQLPLLAIKIIFQLSKSRKSQPELIHIFRSDPDSCKNFAYACMNYLGHDDPRMPDTSFDVYDNHCPSGAGSAMSRSILHLILLNLTSPVKPEANLAHVLLGFDAKYSDYREIKASTIGNAEIHRSCLHKMLVLLEDQRLALLDRDPEFCELVLKLVYKMCYVTHTSTPTLRFLRSQNFFVTHIHRLVAVSRSELAKGQASGTGADEQWQSFQPSRRYCALLNCQGWFLKAVALDIFVTSKSQRPVDPQILKLLFVGPGMAAGSTSDPQMKVLSLLQPVDFTQVPVKFDIDGGEEYRLKINRIYEKCIVKREDQDGLIWCDIPELIGQLEYELKYVPSLMGDESSLTFEDDIERIVHAATEFNLLRQSVVAKRNFFDGWRRVIGVTLVLCPVVHFARTRTISDLLVALFEQLDKADVIPDMVEPLSDSIVILMANLRESTLGGQQQSDGSIAGGDDNLSDYAAEKILNGVKNGILRPDADAKARQNMYGALLFYLQIVSDGHVDRERTDRFMEMVCRDACDGQGIRASLSLAAIDAMVALDNSKGHNRWLTFLQRRGFLNLFVNEILERDRDLIQQLVGHPSSLLPLHLHQAKMTLLNRLALSASGAAGLAQAEVLWRLKDCRFISARPSDASTQHLGVLDTDQLPLPAERHRELVFPVLHLAISMLQSAVGVQRKEITEQVLHFIASHAEGYFKVVLRSPSQDWPGVSSASALEELSLVTALVKQISQPDDAALTESVLAHQTVLFQTLMVSLLESCARLFPERSASQLAESTRFHPSGHMTQQLEKLQLDKHLLVSTANVVSYVGAIMSTSSVLDGSGNGLSGADRSPLMLLRPSLTEDTDAANKAFPAGTPSLAVILVLLNKSFDVYKKLKAEVLELAAVDTNGTTEQLPSTLQKEYRQHTIEARDIALYIVENSLHVLWKHLDWYLSDSARKRPKYDKVTDGIHRGALKDSYMDLRDEDLKQLRREFVSDKNLTSLDGPSASPESLLKKLYDEEKARYQNDDLPRTTIQPLARRLSELRKATEASLGRSF